MAVVACCNINDITEMKCQGSDMKHNIQIVDRPQTYSLFFVNKHGVRKYFHVYPSEGLFLFNWFQFSNIHGGCFSRLKLLQLSIDRLVDTRVLQLFT